MSNLHRSKSKGRMPQFESAANWLRRTQSAATQVLARTRYKPGIPQDRDGIWITVGADCPWNTTPGIRQVHHFKNTASRLTQGQ